MASAICIGLLFFFLRRPFPFIDSRDPLEHVPTITSQQMDHAQAITDIAEVVLAPQGDRLFLFPLIYPRQPLT